MQRSPKENPQPQHNEWQLRIKNNSNYFWICLITIYQTTIKQIIMNVVSRYIFHIAQQMMLTVVRARKKTWIRDLFFFLKKVSQMDSFLHSFMKCYIYVFTWKLKPGITKEMSSCCCSSFSWFHSCCGRCVELRPCPMYFDHNSVLCVLRISTSF